METFPKNKHACKNFFFQDFPAEIQINKLKKGAELIHAENFVSVLKTKPYDD